MLKFYEAFDAIDFKYSLEKDHETEYIEKYGDLEKIESARQFTELTNIEYGDILTNLDMIYAGEEQSDQVVMLFDLVRNKIINQYINIEGLERLFSEKYIDFEWDMHLGIDYKKHKMNFYRDHFVHQIRNAYAMHSLLEQFGFQERIAAALKDQNNSKISQYVCKYIDQQKVSGYYNGKRGMDCYNTDDFYYKNIIYMSSYLSALFHDIGYPEASNTINQRRITEYIANLYHTGGSGYNYSRLNALLQNSLLFRVVPFREIQNRLSEDKPDHGALSAVIFLLNFYENGAIHVLSPYKKCAVELAALAIYNHTNHYSYNKSLKNDEYVRCVFTLNPISYLLRLCDDLQEWNRIYFELSNRSNLILCNACKTPIIRKKLKEDLLSSSGRILKYYYSCNCNYINRKLSKMKKSEVEKDGYNNKEYDRKIELAENGVFQPVFTYSENFPYRRIYNVSVCTNLKIDKREQEQVLCFTLEYELSKLLHIAYINPEYAKYRIEELNELKKLLDFQKELPQMKLVYFITANPILIKTQIMAAYFVKTRTQLVEEMDRLYDLYENGEWEDEFNQILSTLHNQIKDIIQSIYPAEAEYSLIVESVKMSSVLYLQLMMYMLMHQRCNQNGCPIKGLIIKAKKELSHISDQSCEVQELVADSWKQFTRMYFDIGTITSNPPDYYEQFKTSEYTYGCIKRFVSANYYWPVLEGNRARIDAYTDLGLIQALL